MRYILIALCHPEIFFLASKGMVLNYLLITLELIDCHEFLVSKLSLFYYSYFLIFNFLIHVNKNFIGTKVNTLVPMKFLFTN